MTRDIAVLGATGSIGTQTLDAVRRCLPDCKVRVLTGNRNVEKLAVLIDEFAPDMAWVPDGRTAKTLKNLIRQHCEILTGPEELIVCASESGAGTVVNAISGCAGLELTLAAAEAGCDIALANKESLVTAGALVMGKVKEKNIRLTPIDSEHCAIAQCLQGNENNTVEKLIITASGGPFRGWPKEKIKNAAASDALKHPNWLMGPKITIDSATLMNKGLEVIEAMWLFNIPLDDIQAVVHPQSIIHSMVMYADGCVMAQMGLPDMRLPILYALSSPERVVNDFPRLDLLTMSQLTFEAPDVERFPCFKLASYAARTGGTLPAVMNMLNELAVGLYLQNKIGFYEISRILEDGFSSYTVTPAYSLEAIRAAEDWARAFFARWIENRYSDFD